MSSSSLRRPALARATALVILLTAMLPALPASADIGSLRWEQWHSQAGVVDVAGPLSTGELVVAAGQHLFRLSPGGGESELAPAYAVSPLAPPPGSEPYIAVAPPEVSGTSCPFVRDTVFAIRPATPGSVVRIDLAGRVDTFVSLPDSGGLNGITFDTVGRFGHRLLITGGLPGDHTAVVAIDCHGSATTLTRTGPRLEGGVQVAPASFPGYGGDLIAPDELSGRVVAVDPSGDSAVVAESQVPAGGDTGVEGVAFVPPGFLSGGHAYTADRGTPGSPHPGTDTLLRLPAPSFASAGAHEGDMLLVTEASDLIVDIHCDHGCTARTLGMGAEPAHGEGHLLLVADHPRPPATAAATVGGGGGGGHAGTVLTVIAAVLIGGAAVLLAATVSRRRRARSRS